MLYPPPAQEKKISLNIQQIVTPPPAPKPKPIPQPVIKKPIKEVLTPKPEVVENKKIVLDKSKKLFAVKSTQENNVSKIEPKPIQKIVQKEKKEKSKKIVKKKIVKQKRVAKKKQIYKKPQRSNDPLANMLMGSGTSMSPKRTRSAGAGTYGEQMIKKLYGSEFDSYTPTQKKYIRDNLSIIHQITQHTLTRNGYPEVAVRTRQQGTNVVSFYLHPNGDISGLRLKTSIGYAALDDNTLQVIRLAYKNYPLPNKKTRLIFYVSYTIY